MKKFEAEGRLVYYNEFGDHTNLTIGKTDLIEALRAVFKPVEDKDWSTCKIDFGKVRITVEKIDAQT